MIITMELQCSSMIIITGNVEENKCHFKSPHSFTFCNFMRNHNSYFPHPQVTKKALKFHNVVSFPESDIRPDDDDDRHPNPDRRQYVPVQCVLSRDPAEESPPESDDDELTGSGSLSLDITQYSDDTFRTPLGSGNSPLVGAVGDDLYFGAELTAVDGFALFLESCWLSTSPMSTNDIRHVIISDGYYGNYLYFGVITVQY